MEKGKRTKWSGLFLHGAIYTLCMAVVLFLTLAYSQALLKMFLFVAVTHIAIDFAKRYLNWRRIYTIDQLTHLCMLGIAWFTWGRNLLASELTERLVQHISERDFVVILGLLILLRPVGQLIQAGDIWDFNKKSKMEGLDKIQQGTGGIIGYLERIIVFFILIHGQYAAISFIIAAKSVIWLSGLNSKDGAEKSSLAEYYLIGTLLSMTSVFLVSLLLGLMRI